MRYGLSFYRGRGFTLFKDRFPSVCIWWGCFAIDLFLYSPRGWFRYVKFNMNTNYPPDYYGLKGWFIGIQTDKIYPSTKENT